MHALIYPKFNPKYPPNNYFLDTYLTLLEFLMKRSSLLRKKHSRLFLYITYIHNIVNSSNLVVVLMDSVV